MLATVNTRSCDANCCEEPSGARGRAPARAPREVDAGVRRAARHAGAVVRHAAADDGHDPHAQPKEGSLSMARPKQHPGYIERHGTGYRVSLCIRGRRHRFTVHAESKADAAEWAAAKHKEL